MNAAADAAEPRCPNCGNALRGAYCSSCGQKAGPVAPTLSHLAHELTHEFLHVDGKIFRSVRLLLTRPGFLTREIFAGRRASYVSPIRLYLIASILAFAIGTFGGFDAVSIEYTPSPGEPAEAVAAGEEISGAVTAVLNVWLPRAMFVLVPVFAALVMSFGRRGSHTYPQHLYFALHVHSAWFAANAVDSAFEALDPTGLAARVIDIASELYIVGYFVVAYWRAYETTLWGAVWRALCIGLLYAVSLLVVMAAIIAPVFLR